LRDFRKLLTSKKKLVFQFKESFSHSKESKEGLRLKKTNISTNVFKPEDSLQTNVLMLRKLIVWKIFYSKTCTYW